MYNGEKQNVTLVTPAAESNEELSWFLCPLCVLLCV